jgi:hypothetical protein
MKITVMTSFFTKWYVNVEGQMNKFYNFTIINSERVLNSFGVIQVNQLIGGFSYRH